MSSIDDLIYGEANEDREVENLLDLDENDEEFDYIVTLEGISNNILLNEEFEKLTAKKNKYITNIMVRTQEGSGKSGHDNNHSISIKVKIGTVDERPSPFYLNSETKSCDLDDGARKTLLKHHSTKIVNEVEKSIKKFVEDNYDDIVTIWHTPESKFDSDETREILDRLQKSANKL